MGKRLQMVIGFLFVILLCQMVSNSPVNGNYAECDPEHTTCEYWFVIEPKLTMIYKGMLVYAKDSKLYKFDESPGNYTTKILEEEVITTDGFYRSVITVNGSIPGPPLVVYEGQVLIVHVKNMLMSDTVSIHWHGLFQRGTPFMDGTPYITQCPIGAGQSFTYQFEASPAGTMWYHSHTGTQRMNGLFGALIIKERISKNDPPPTDMIMTVGDWYHQSAEDVFIKSQDGFFIDGKEFPGIPWIGGLIEGKGRYNDLKTGKRSETPVTVYDVTPSHVYRFRVIQAGGTYSVRISVDQHVLTVIASDGGDITPIQVESFIISPGERMDFLLRTDQNIGNYWLRAEKIEYVHTIEDSGSYVEAIIHYDGASMEEPTTQRNVCTEEKLCHVLNCQYYSYPFDQHINCLYVYDTENAKSEDRVPLFEEDSEEHFLNFHLPGPAMMTNPGAVNGHIFQYTGTNSLLQRDEIQEFDCSRANCGHDKLCTCNYELEIPYNKTIQLVLINTGAGGVIGHPLHLHGHSFHVLKMEFYNSSDYLYYQVTHPHIDCGGSKLNYCNEARWKNSTWQNGNIPGLNLKNPPRKDTLYVPTGGYAVVRFRSDNPGKWFIHCHVQEHLLEGMAMVISEAVEHVPDGPKGFPVCQNFYNDKQKDVGYIRKKNCVSRNLMASILIAGMAFAVFQFIVIIILAQRRLSSSGEQKPISSTGYTLIDGDDETT